MAANFGRHHHVGREVGTEPAVDPGHADLQQPGLAQIVVVLERERGLAVVARGARRELLAPERGGELDQLALLRREKSTTAPLNAAGCSTLAMCPAAARQT